MPALGGGAEDRPWFQANEITRRWAVTLRHPRYLHAPAFVSSALKRSLDHEEGVHSTLDLWDRAKVALVGIGAYPKPTPASSPSASPTATRRSLTPRGTWSAASSPTMGR